MGWPILITRCGSPRPCLLSPLALRITIPSILTITIPATVRIPRLHSLSSHLLCPAHFQNPHFAISTDDDEEEEERVVGDCLVFEDGIFEDPYLEEQLNPPISSVTPPSRKSKTKEKATLSSDILPQNLVPEEWSQIVEQINLTKKERRKIAQELEFGQRIEKKKRVRNVNLEEYLRLRNEKLSQLNPVVLDKPASFPAGKGQDYNEEDALKRREDVNYSGNTRVEPRNPRVEPRNPRWAVYGRGLDDITEFFNSGNYQPSDDKPGGKIGRRLFTKEEKTLMNARIPKLELAASQKWLPLHAVAASGESYLVNTLLKYNVDINAADQDGLTALHKAIASKKQGIADYLLRESANPFVRDKDGATLMHYAVRTVSVEAIKTLLLHDVDINLQDNDGWTPLHLAVQSRRTDVVRLLLMKGADKTLKNQDGLTPLELCLHSGRDTKTYELIKLLKELPRHRH